VSATAIAPTIDVDAYLARIGYTGSRSPTLSTLRALHLHHVLAVPFENLDVLLDRTLSLELPDLERKFVHQRRGGYCYEQNTLFASVLRALGFEVTNLIARVRWQIPPERSTPRSHMILRVAADHEQWIVDVGFGSIGLTAPLHFALDREQSTPHEPRRLIRRDDYFVHQVRRRVARCFSVHAGSRSAGRLRGGELVLEQTSPFAFSPESHRDARAAQGSRGALQSRANAAPQ
jgi:N-hydroxyarylamine O-acetyltransferase